ncbi:MAG: DUF4124 domain-containing protein [Azoarcus sp.]|jgi:hypothetical protein|nr:DUF4124 domain-containing protein [Azoarcus sp.]
MKTILLILGLCLSGAALAGSVYRWTDEQGQAHYSDAPPAGVEARAVGRGNITVIPAPPALTPEVLEANRRAYRKASEERRFAELQVRVEEERAARQAAEHRIALREDCQLRHAVPCNDEGLPLEPVARTVIHHDVWLPPHAVRPPHRPRRSPKPSFRAERPRRPPAAGVSIRRQGAAPPGK